MKQYEIVNNFGRAILDEYSDGTYSLHGNMKAAAAEFKAINRRPPNVYGNFGLYEKAGYAACKKLIEKNVAKLIGGATS